MTVRRRIGLRVVRQMGCQMGCQMGRRMAHHVRKALGLALGMCLVLTGLWLPKLYAAEAMPTREVHGAADAFAEPGLALAWGVLRDRDEARTQVVLRIEADPQRYAGLRITGRDPFGGASVERLAPVALKAAAGAAQSTPAVIEVRILRSAFADYPRTELRLTPTTGSVAPLLVFYLGVPDTTPEFIDAAALVADMNARLNRARTKLSARP